MFMKSFLRRIRSFFASFRPMPPSQSWGASEPNRADRANLAESSRAVPAAAAAAAAAVAFSTRFPLINRSNSTGTVSSSESFDLHSICRAPSQQVRVVSVPRPRRVQVERRSDDLVQRSLSPDFVAPLVFTDRPAETQSSLRFVQRVQFSRQSASTLVRRRSSLAIDTTAHFQPEFVLHQPSPRRPGIESIINYQAELSRQQAARDDSAVDENSKDYQINKWLSQRVDPSPQNSQSGSEEASLHSNPSSFVVGDDQSYQPAIESRSAAENTSSFSLRRHNRRPSRPARFLGFSRRFTEPTSFPQNLYEGVEPTAAPLKSAFDPADKQASLQNRQSPRKRA